MTPTSERSTRGTSRKGSAGIKVSQTIRQLQDSLQGSSTEGHWFNDEYDDGDDGEDEECKPLTIHDIVKLRGLLKRAGQQGIVSKEETEWLTSSLDQMKVPVNQTLNETIGRGSELESLMKPQQQLQQHQEESVSSHKPTDRNGNNRNRQYLIAQPPDKRGPDQIENGQVEKAEENDNDSNNDDRLVETKLSQDTFSFLIAAPFFSTPYWTGVFIFCLKNVIYALVFLDMIDVTVADGNYLSIPVAVETSVMITQAMSFVIAVFTQTDLIQALMMLYEGYYAQRLGKAFRGSSFIKWISAVIALFLDGSLGLVVTFMLIVNSGTALDVILNFAAIEFVAGLDEAAFYLSNLGFLGKRNQREAHIIANTTYKVSRHHTPWLQVLLMISIVVMILGGWAVVGYRQFTGFFVVNSLVVQFDDSVNPAIGAHSGIYNMKLRAGGQPASRFWFVETRTGEAMFAYCKPSRTWNFFVGFQDPCSDTLAESSQLVTFDITETSVEPWFAIRPGTTYPVEMENFLLSPVCEFAQDCGEVSDCVDNLCHCPNYAFGLRCEFRQQRVCPELQIDARLSDGFGSIRQIATTFETLLAGDGNIALVFRRPVFWNPQSQDLILYLGLRWAVTNVIYLRDFNSTAGDGANLAAYLMDLTFHPLRSVVSLDLLSEPMRFFTPEDNDSPVGLQWFAVTNTPAGLEDADIQADSDGSALLCAVCNNETNPCKFGNTCNPDGTCDCRNGALGRLCEIEPLTNGKCDTFFNVPAFNKDGGDCCSQTCITSDFDCGFIAEGKLDFVDVGYTNCQDADVTTSCLEGGRCFVRSADPIEPSIPTGRPYVTVAPNGRILVVAEPILNTVRVYDIVGRSWVQRGQTLQGPLESQYGGSLSIFSPPASIKKRIGAEIPIALAVGDSLNGWIQLVRWSTLKRIWVVEGTINLEALGILQCGATCDDFLHLELGMEYVGSTFLATVLVQVTPAYLTTATQGNSTFVFRQHGASWQFSSYRSPSLASLSLDGRVLVMLEEPTRNMTVVETATERVVATAENPFQSLTGGSTSRALRMQVSYLGDEVSVAGNLDSSSGDAVAGFFTRHKICSNNIATLAVRSDMVAFGSRDSVTFSRDGTAAVCNNGGSSIESFRCVADTWLLLGAADITIQQQNQQDVGGVGVGVGLSFGLSQDGSVIGAPNPRDSITFGMHRRCTSDQVAFRLSAIMDRTTGPVSWSLCSGLNLGGGSSSSSSNNNNGIVAHRMLGGCNDCYRNAYALDDSPGSIRSVMVEEMCVPKALTECLVFGMKGIFSGMYLANETVGFAAYLYEETQGIGEPFAFMDTPPTTTQQQQQQQQQASGFVRTTIGTCPQETVLSCPDTESLVIVGIADTDLENVNVTLSNNSSQMVFAPGLTSTPSLGGGRLQQTCVPKTSCVSFSVAPRSSSSPCGDQGTFFLLSGFVEVARGNIGTGQTGRFGACW